jgi:hypothetical protein
MILYLSFVKFQNMLELKLIQKIFLKIIQIFLNSTGVVQSPTWTFGASGGATQTATASGNTAGASTWLVSSAVEDINGIGVTAKGGTATVT